MPLTSLSQKNFISFKTKKREEKIFINKVNKISRKSCIYHYLIKNKESNID